MSANGAFSSTVDYSFFGAGYITITANSIGALDFTQSSSGTVLNTGILDQNLTFDFVSNAGAPFLGADFVGSIDFSVSATAEIGEQTSGNAFGRLPLSGSASAVALVQGYVDYSYEFGFSSTLTQYSEADSDTSINFGFSSTGLNISTHSLDRLGKNDIKLGDQYLNGINLVSNMNSVKIVDAGIRKADVLQR